MASERAIRYVHGADDIEVAGHMYNFAGLPAIGEFDALGMAALRVLQQRKHLTEDLGWIAPVDLLNDEHERQVWLALRRVDCLHQNTIHEGEPPFARRPPAAYEVLIRE
jgi:hypothetical protein